MGSRRAHAPWLRILYCQAWILVGLLSTHAAAGAPPNILLLVAEDLGPRIGAFGDGAAVTPHIDALAEEGVRFTRTFTTAGVCAPSRAALITGRHQMAIGAQHMRTSTRPEGDYRSVPPANVKAFPELLRAHGYYTFVTEKLDYQFSGPFLGSGPFTIWDEEGGEAYWEGREAEQPFFGMINFGVTHESAIFRGLGSWPHGVIHFVMQVVYAYRYGLGGLPIPEASAPEKLSLPPYYPDTPVVREDLARHYANIHEMDRQVGEVLARLDVAGLADSTIVIWTTDHGDGLPRAKRELFDSGLLVPMIVRWPEAHRPDGRRPGEIDTRLVSFVDLAPTILAMAGAGVPSDLPGFDFADPAAPPRPFVFASRDRIDEVEDRQRASRDARFKYIRSDRPEQPGGHELAFRDNQEIMRELWRLKDAGALDADALRWFEPPGRERLFDTEADPYELRDLSGDPAHRADLERLRDAVDGWLERIGAAAETPESEMVEAIWPGGDQPVTPPPRLRVVGDRVTIESPVEGASIGFRLDEGRWQVYVAPFTRPPGAEVIAKAVRYGWKESAEVHSSR